MTGIAGKSAAPALAEPATSPPVGEAGQTGQPNSQVRLRRFAVVMIACVLAGSVLVACSGSSGVSPSSSSTAGPAAALPDAGTPAGAQLACS